MNGDELGIGVAIVLGLIACLTAISAHARIDDATGVRFSEAMRHDGSISSASSGDPVVDMVRESFGTSRGGADPANLQPPSMLGGEHGEAPVE